VLAGLFGLVPDLYGIPVAPDAGVARGTAVLYANQPGVRVTALVDVNAPVTDIRVERP